MSSSQSESEELSEAVIVLKERHIPVSKDHFLSVLLDKFDRDKDKELFGKLCSAIEALFYVNNVSRIEVMYLYFFVILLSFQIIL